MSESKQPTIEDLLGAPPAVPQPADTVEGLLGPKPAQPSLSGPGYDEYFGGNTQASHLLETFGQGFKSGWGADKLGMSPEKTTIWFDLPHLVFSLARG